MLPCCWSEPFSDGTGKRCRHTGHAEVDSRVRNCCGKFFTPRLRNSAQKLRVRCSNCIPSEMYASVYGSLIQLDNFECGFVK